MRDFDVNLENYEKLLAEVLPILRRGRPGDAAHIKSAYKNAQKYFKSEVHNPRILFPAVILHDIGFGLLRKEFIPLVAGGKKSKELAHAITAVSSAYVTWILPKYGFTDDEIKAIRQCIELGDEEQLSLKNPPEEMILLHDLNFLDRFYPHRIRVARLRRSEDEVREIMARSLGAIIRPEIKEEAQRRHRSLSL